MRQPFSFEQFAVNSAALQQLTPNAVGYVDETDFATMSYSGADDVTAPVTAVDVNLVGDRASTSGCEATDFAGFTAGNIALIQRGTCTFRVKVDNAAAAGAAGVVIFNQGNSPDRLGLLFGTLGAPQAAIPAVGATFALGQELAGLAELTMRLAVDASVDTVETFNILADTVGRADRTVVVGAHLDSTTAGPAINDDGTGSAAILETAIQLAKSGETPRNRVRFAFWASEEDGLLGSTYYVSQLTGKELKDQAVNLAFDMLGSPNYVRFVYDGDGSTFGTATPNGSAQVEQVFQDYFASQGLATEPTELDGRTDYAPFLDAGIPVGGLFTGAEGTKTADEAEVYGGTAGEAYDSCYHQACDRVDNIDPVVLGQMSDALVHATLTFANTTSAINGTAEGGGSGNASLPFAGNKAVK